MLLSRVLGKSRIGFSGLWAGGPSMLLRTGIEEGMSNVEGQILRCAQDNNGGLRSD
ncbi:MAG: hypothetical protein ACYSX1_09950 [Planctomycetota bacterium]|jgi:hypothetical protein